MKKLLTLAFIVAFAGVAFGAQFWNPFSTNPASAYPTGGQVPVWGGTAWSFGSGGSATNLSPWSEDINAANYSLTNASTVRATNITGDSTIARTNANHFALSVTNFQGITGQGGFIVTNHNAAGVVLNDALTWQGAHVTTTVQDDDQSFIVEPAGSGNLPDFIFYTNGNFRFPGVAINGFGRTLMDTVATTNAFNYLMTNSAAGYPTNMIGVDANGLVVHTNLPTGGGTAIATNAIANLNGSGTNTALYSATAYDGLFDPVFDLAAGIVYATPPDGQTANLRGYALYGPGSKLHYNWQSGLFYLNDGATVSDAVPTNAIPIGAFKRGTGTNSTDWSFNGSGLTNLNPATAFGSGTLSVSSMNVNTLTVTNPPYLNATNMTNGPWVLKAGDTATGPILTTSSTTNGPAQTELVTAQWVRSLLSGGFQYYAGTNVFTGATNTDTAGQPVYAFEPNIPSPPASRAYVNPTAGTYLGAVMITNKLLFVDSPISVNAYMTLSSGGGDAATIHAEMYYSYDGTNWLGNFSGPSFAMTAGATRLYQWTISFPAITSTNSTGFYIERRFKIDSKGGSPTITFLVGTNTTSGPSTASHISLAGPTSAAGNAYLAFNQTFTGTNTFTQPIQGVVNTTNSIGVSIDGGGASISTGQKGYIMAPINSTIVGWSLASTSVGSCVVDVWKCAHTAYPPTVANSIGGSALPTLATTNWFYTNSLAGWSTSVTNGDWFGWNVNSATTISNLTLQIYTVPR